jgi:hypothetical protein
MDNSKEAMQYLLSLDEPHYKEYCGMLFCDRSMYQLKTVPDVEILPAPDKIEAIKTLSGLVTLLKASECIGWPMMYVMVSAPDSVYVITKPREDASRAMLFKAQAVLPQIAYGQFIDQESMIIMLRSRFVQTDGCTALIALLGSIKEKSVKQTNDDGISQSVVAKTGIGTVGLTPVEPIQTLKPYRTFLEVDQPKSEFLFRLKSGAQDGVPPMMALFEADGGAWRNAATANVAEYLRKELVDIKNITVIQ